MQMQGQRATQQKGLFEEVDLFESFWEHYPRKVARRKAEVAWMKLSEVKKVLALEAILIHVKLWRTRDTPDEMIPHAATWLNGERFRDEMPKPAGAVHVVGDCGHSLAGGSTMYRNRRLCNTCWEKR